MNPMVRILEKVKTWLGPVWWYAVIMFAVQRFGDVVNLYAGLWLIPKWVPRSELGALLPLTQIGALLGLPLAIMLTPFAKFINAFGAKEEYGKVKALLLDALGLAAVSAAVIGVYTWLSAPLVLSRMRIAQTGILWLLCCLAVTSIFMPILNSALQALKRFRCMSVIGLVAAPTRLIVLLLLLPFSGLLGYFSAQVMLYAVSISIGLWGLRKALSRSVRRESYRSHLKEMCLYSLPIALTMSVGSISTAVQFFVIRQRLPDMESAAFYFASRFSEIPNILWSAVGIAFFPLVSEAFEKGKDTSRMLMQSLAFTVLGGGAVAVVLGVGIERLFGMVATWKDYQPYAYLVIWLSVTNVLRVAFACFSTHEMACRRFGFVFYCVPLALMEAFVLVSLTGYGFFAPYLPETWIAWMASLRAARIEFIVGVMFSIAALQFLGVLAQVAMRGLFRRAPHA